MYKVGGMNIDENFFCFNKQKFKFNLSLMSCEFCDPVTFICSNYLRSRHDLFPSSKTKTNLSRLDICYLPQL